MQPRKKKTTDKKRTAYLWGRTFRRQIIPIASQCVAHPGPPHVRTDKKNVFLEVSAMKKKTNPRPQAAISQRSVKHKHNSSAVQHDRAPRSISEQYSRATVLQPEGETKQTNKGTPKRKTLLRRPSQQRQVHWQGKEQQQKKRLIGDFRPIDVACPCKQKTIHTSNSSPALFALAQETVDAMYNNIASTGS